MSTLRSLLLVTAGLACSAGSAAASAIDLDFGVVDDASYQSFRGAVFASEYVRTDYALEQRPRVVVAAAGLAAFATRNPDATATQLEAFVTAFDAALGSFAPGDPDLQRSTNLMPAMRFGTPLDGVAELVGADTRVGEDIERALGLDVPAIQSYDQILDRMVAFDRARVTEFAHASEWASLLTASFAGFDLEGNTNSAIAGVMRGYLESQGFEPVPDGIDDERFIAVTGALDGALPADFAGYAALLAQPVETSPAWSQIQGAFGGIAAETATRVTELNAALDSEQSLYDQIANAGDPATLEQLADEYRARLAAIADERAIIAANSMMLLQSADPSVRALAQQSRTFAGTQLQTNDTVAGITAGINYASALTTFGFGIATGSPADAITGLADVVLSSIELGETFGGSSVPSAEEQIFDELIEMRAQIEEVRVEMNMRFDRIEQQLSLLYDTVATGFNALGASIDDLSLDVQALTEQVMLQRSALERIEDQLWGMANDIFENDLAELINAVLGYRDQRGEDLPYSGANTNFSDSIIDLVTRATFTASNQTYAGGDGSTLDPDNVADLEVQPIGRSINDLRVFPQQHLGFAQPLWPDRVVSPGAWAQAASAYVQVANESPWYFGFMYDSQTTASPPIPVDIESVIAEGEAFRSMASNARSEALFNALFDRYDLVIDAMQSQLDLIVAGEMSNRSLPNIDPWGGLDQPGRIDAPEYTVIDGRNGLTDVTAPTVLGDDLWDIIPGTRVPELASAILSAGGNGGIPTVELRMDANGFLVENDVSFEFTLRIPRNSGSDYVFRRTVVGELTSFGSPVQISNDGAAQDLIDQTPIFWFNIALQFYTGSALTGTSFNTFNGLGDQITIEWVADTQFSIDLPAATAFVTAELDGFQDAIWLSAQSDSVLDAFETTRDGWATIIDAYLTLAMPDVLEQSTAVNAALRGNATTSELALAQPLDEWLASQLGDGDGGESQAIDDSFLARSAVVRGEILDAATLPLAGHSLVEWTLAELRHLEANALALAVDDTYVQAGGSLVVGADDGLLANDVGQEYRSIAVDAGFGLVALNGSVSVGADGSFAYTPNPGFVGEDFFQYRTSAVVTDAGSAVTSLPATVRVVVSDASCGAADLAEPFGALNFFDVVEYIALYNAGNPGADLAAPFGTLNFFDVAAYIGVYNAGCP